ncbi:MAG TPA: DUF423 domain-containing protein [Rubricoccaceae bacterium]|nr:DUF423 domain-containing protein [Rubricoccaceae bacterium]
MDRSSRLFVGLGAVSGALAVAAGAFGAHALEGAVAAERLATWATAAHYHLAHALALVAAGLVAAHRPGRLVRAAGWLFLAGTVLFAGSLYALVLLDLPALGAVTPLGGVAFIAGWGCLAAGVWRRA